MNKKLRIIISEPFLVIAFPFSLISLLLIFVARPFIRIRVGFLRCDRIGHFAANTELYLCERDKNNIQTVDLFYYPRNVSNQQLAKMWERKLTVLPWFLLRPLDLIIRSFDFLSSYRAVEARGGDRDIDHLYDRSPPHLEFTAEEEERGKAGLRVMGIPSNAPFVCLTVRDSAYLEQMYKGIDTSFHNYRDSDIQNYVLAAEALADRGYFVIRMGAKVSSPINSRHIKVIDYATNGLRSDFMDIYLGAKCEFCISTSTGWDAVPIIFRRPVVFVNQAPIGLMNSFSRRYLGIMKHHFLKNESRELTLQEIFDHEVGFSLTSFDYLSKGVDLVENTPDEIQDIVIEMAERLEGIWQPREDEESLQLKFLEIFPIHAVGRNGVPLHGEIYSRYGADFLQKNRWWLK